jgi:uncharacterized protein YndB with AHSA1/START domain
MTSPYGTIETRDDGSYVLRFERRLRHPVEKVWTALTDPARMEEWWARAAVLELTEGGRARIEWLNTDDEGNQAVAEGHVTRLEPPHTIEFDTDIHGRLLWELRPDENGTHLTLTVTNAIPDEYRAKVLAGWHAHLDFLEEALDGKPVDWPNWPRDRWAELNAHYEEASMRPMS